MDRWAVARVVRVRVASVCGQLLGVPGRAIMGEAEVAVLAVPEVALVVEVAGVVVVPEVVAAAVGVKMILSLRGPEGRGNLVANR